MIKNHFLLKNYIKWVGEIIPTGTIKISLIVVVPIRNSVEEEEVVEEEAPDIMIVMLYLIGSLLPDLSKFLSKKFFFVGFNFFVFFRDWKTMVSLNEKELGITEYIGTSAEFSGIIKSRYSDFHVNEIDIDGNLVELTDKSIPVPDMTGKSFFY